MEKVRVFHLAKEFGVESIAVMTTLKEMGEFVRSASSALEPPVVHRLREFYGRREPASGLVQHTEPAEIKSLSHLAAAAQSNTELPSGPIHELLETWDLLLRLAPDPSVAIGFLAEQSKLSRAEIDRVRRVRNQCAHPSNQGWPKPYDLDMALATARELRRRLIPPMGPARSSV